MASPIPDVDVAVIGAGAAGLAAARRVQELGHSTLVLEARGRAGGRAWTVEPHPGLPVDLGCGWLHSADRNPWTEIARTTGFAVEERLPAWGGRLAAAGMDAAAQQSWTLSRERFYDQLAAVVPPDGPASALLEPGDRWNAMLDAIGTWVSGAELDQVSRLDLKRYADSGINWRVAEGYGRLIVRHGDGLPVRLACPVRQVDWRGTAIAVETDAGKVTAQAVIVTVPTNLLALGALRFTPDLPAAKLNAAAGLPLGADEKLYFRITGDIAGVGPETYRLGSPDRTRTAGYLVKPLGRPLVEAYVGGNLARELAAAGPDAFAAFALDELAGLFGSDIRKRLVPLAASAWTRDPWSLGAYSYAKPGHADDRAILAAPVDDRLFFAGEATSADSFSTAHGAYLSGRRSAEEAAAALSRRPSRTG
ncbi:amine oxidase [Aliidongia dinghuensis]|uniref:Tryptophan 2-monooxygenase n=1 Tax=Aliidongia dinghuensis TaxID=1867774 RepID=A0A8J2YYL0_9PROT|nr:NAD(P)/FAD-dependent oxidoreductase [Aliidongia dinghuensis]GGF41434.1 amine oxidase [Aliidongia dinghuensis]